MNASELTQRRRLCSLARAQQCAPASARRPLPYEYRNELLSTEYPCLPAEISAPQIDFNSVNVTYTGPLDNTTVVSYSFSWGCVPGATHYKVFIRGPAVLNNYINTGKPPTYTNFRTVSMIGSTNMFTDISPLLTATTYSGTVVLDPGPKLNIYVFAYRNGKRSDIPCTQLCLYRNPTFALTQLEASLWPVVTQEIVGGDGFASGDVYDFDTVTVRDRVSGQTRTLTSEDPTVFETNYYPEEVIGTTAIASALF